MINIIVTGGRHTSNPKPVFDWLDQILAALGDWRDELTIHQGGATGVDKHAREWCMARGVAFVNYPYPPNMGKAGGPSRNRAMAVRGRPDFVVAFKGGRGTKSMVGIALELGIKVINAGYEGVTR